MAIIMNQAEQVFTLQTKRTTYQMKAGDYGILLHLYYGARVEDCTMAVSYTHLSNTSM